MSNDDTSALNQTIVKIIAHLETESKFLDSVVESTLEIQEALRKHREIPREPMVCLSGNTVASIQLLNITPMQAERNRRLNEYLTKLREGISKSFLPVLQGRKKLVELLATIDPTQTRAPTVSELAVRVDEPYRSQLKSLRTEMRAKLSRVHSISMGNQAVLIYTLDFYNRLLNGLSQEGGGSTYYNQMGKSKQLKSGNFIQTNC